LLAGFPLKVAPEQHGHSSLAITADMGTSVLPAVARATAEAVAGAVPRAERRLGVTSPVTTQPSEGEKSMIHSPVERQNRRSG